jgi:hypothetical protein
MIYTPLKNSIRTADEFSTKLPVTDLYGDPLWGADSNLHWYNKQFVNYNPQTSKYLPPGYIVGSIWVLLFGILGYIIYRLQNYTSVASISIYGFILFSVLYPFITKLSPGSLSDMFNKFALVLAYMVCYLVYSENPGLTNYLLPLFCWITYVNLVV